MTFFLSDGQLRSLDTASAWWPNYTIPLLDNKTVSYAHLYKTQPALRMVVSFLARNIAQLGLHVFERTSDTDRTRLTDHPLTALLTAPNSSTTQYRLVNDLVSDISVYDAAYWIKTRADNGIPLGLRRIPPFRVEVMGSDWLEPELFRVHGNRGQIDLPAADVVYFRGYHPEDPRLGLSPIESLRAALIEEAEATQYRQQLWRNGARLSGQITRPVDAPAWSETARERFRAQWKSQYEASGPETGGTPILEDGMAWQQAGMNPQQAQYLEARKLTREEVASAYHIPAPMVGILDHATFSNVTEQHKNLYQDTLGPWLAMLCQEIGLQLIPDIPGSGSIYVEFNLEAKMRGSFEEQAQAASTAVGGPWLTRNEQRGRVNLPALPGGDELITPLNVTEGGQASPRDSAPDQSDTGTTNSVSRAVARKSHTLRTPASEDSPHARRLEKALTGYFTRQKEAVTTDSRKGDRHVPVLVPPRLASKNADAELAGLLYGLGITVSTAVGRETLAQLGYDPDDYDPDQTVNWMRAHTDAVAAAVNHATSAQVEQARQADDPSTALAAVFATAIGQRAAQIARTETTHLSGFATSESLRQNDVTATKTWRVHSPRPRKSHQRMDGETVPLHGKFSNGAKWPADSVLDTGERAGCTCVLDITID